ncbi:MAG: hypothetical protein HN742_14740 [Lentisphaerae bacterium]|mgnify:CR=1|nr:hypothetical protein [Lentisphaerota bacterium]MBT4822617.1 hypothetical protein [Lentisphaerota bacterium]MBT5612516.1 hypothetical protein [Lentisphaerota bacterium]MBT7057461.1 hypothetical protein [Lentisphaerota bacterium]MBT7843134.1 hypothetical protein [Lentisphaerota bacterium]
MKRNTRLPCVRIATIMSVAGGCVFSGHACKGQPVLIEDGNPATFSSG